MKELSWIAVAVAVAACSGCSILPSASVTPRYGRLDISGEVAVSSTGIGVSTTTEGLGLEAESVLQPRVDFSWGPGDFMLTGFDTRYRGSGVAEADLDLGGVVINIGEPVSTVLDLGVYSLVGTWDLIPGKSVDLGVGLGAAAIDFDAAITSLTTSETIASNDEFILPVVSARAKAEAGPFRANLQWSGMMGDYAGVEGQYHDIDFFGQYEVFSAIVHTAFVVGYRIIITDLKYDDGGSEIDAELDFAGFYFGLTVGV